jgi:hypothetical protein
VPFSEAKQAWDLLGGGAFTLTLFRIKRQLGNFLALHGKTRLALDERLNLGPRDLLARGRRYQRPVRIWLAIGHEHAR